MPVEPQTVTGRPIGTPPIPQTGRNIHLAPIRQADGEEAAPSTRMRREPRKDVRVMVRVAIRPQGSAAREFFGWVHNLSVGGMYVRSAQFLPAGTRCAFQLSFRDGDEPREVHVSGRVAYVNESGLGISFDRLGHRDMAALRRALNCHLEETA